VKIAVVGKGGSGKTMVTSTLAYIFAQKGKNVYAIDADPDPALGQALGFPLKILQTIEPVVSMKQVIRERTGSASGGDPYGSYFRLNPRVDDLPERCSGIHRSIRLLIMGATRGYNTGCACTENTIVKALITYLVLGTDDTVIMDMVAGTEHMGRGTASGVNTFVIVVEPSLRSIQAANSIIHLIRQFGNLNYRIIGNKIKNYC
jgi:CO dehydrogenase maturation factor